VAPWTTIPSTTRPVSPSASLEGPRRARDAPIAARPIVRIGGCDPGGAGALGAASTPTGPGWGSGEQLGGVDRGATGALQRLPLHALDALELRFDRLGQHVDDDGGDDGVGQRRPGRGDHDGEAAVGVRYGPSRRRSRRAGRASPRRRGRGSGGSAPPTGRRWLSTAGAGRRHSAGPRYRRCPGPGPIAGVGGSIIVGPRRVRRPPRLIMYGMAGSIGFPGPLANEPSTSARYPECTRLVDPTGGIDKPAFRKSSGNPRHELPSSKATLPGRPRHGGVGGSRLAGRPPGSFEMVRPLRVRPHLRPARNPAAVVTMIPTSTTAYASVMGKPRKLDSVDFGGLIVTVVIAFDVSPNRSETVTVTVELSATVGMQVREVRFLDMQPAGSPAKTYVRGGVPFLTATSKVTAAPSERVTGVALKETIEGGLAPSTTI